MAIGAISANTAGLYVNQYSYRNTNQISRNSLNKISPVSTDVSRTRVDFSEITEPTELTGPTTNPLRKGETANFADILGSQMAMSATRRAALLPQEMLES